MHIVVGRPIPVPRVEHPTPEQARGAAALAAPLATSALRAHHAVRDHSMTSMPAQLHAPLSHILPPTANTTRQVELYLQRFTADLERLFEVHKAAAGHAATSLTIY